MKKATGKYYAPVYTAKEYARRHALPSKPSFGLKHVIAICICAAVVLTGVILLCRPKADDQQDFVSNVKLTGISTYPRIVNKKGKLASSYIPENLVSLNTVPNGETVQLRSDAAESFITMLDAMADDGMAVIPVRGYTTYDEQTERASRIIDTLIASGCTVEEANQLSIKKTISPGADESQLGTSVDIATDIDNIEKFDTTEQYEWICANSCKYGYIVRYTSDKESITGVEAMPWRIRYVGVETAEYMKSQNLCLEEYVEQVTSENPYAAQID